MKKRFIILLYILILLLSLSAYPALSDYTGMLSDEDLADIDYENDCHRSTEDGPGLLWVPDHPYGREILKLYGQMNPKMVVEIVSVIPYRSQNKDNLVLSTANKFLSVSEQEGISYYSSTRKKEMTLIEKSYAVEKVGSRKSVRDPRFRNMPDQLDTVIYQKDSSFGGNYFLYHGEIRDDAAYISMTNKTDMTVMGFFTVAKPDENIMAYILIPCEEALYIYTAVLVSDPPEQERIFGISVNIEGFFLKRVRKLVEWFSLNFDPS